MNLSFSSPSLFSRGGNAGGSAGPPRSSSISSPTSPSGPGAPGNRMVPPPLPPSAYNPYQPPPAIPASLDSGTGAQDVERYVTTGSKPVRTRLSLPNGNGDGIGSSSHRSLGSYGGSPSAGAGTMSYGPGRHSGSTSVGAGSSSYGQRQNSAAKPSPAGQQHQSGYSYGYGNPQNSDATSNPAGHNHPSPQAQNYGPPVHSHPLSAYPDPSGFQSGQINSHGPQPAPNNNRIHDSQQQPNAYGYHDSQQTSSTSRLEYEYGLSGIDGGDLPPPHKLQEGAMGMVHGSPGGESRRYHAGGGHSPHHSTSGPRGQQRDVPGHFSAETSFHSDRASTNHQHHPDTGVAGINSTDSSSTVPLVPVDVYRSASLPWSTHLPDQTSIIFNFLSNHLALLSDCRAFIEAKSALDREYGQKLSVLVKKTSDKLGLQFPGISSSGGSSTTRALALAVGEHPSKSFSLSDGPSDSNAPTTLLRALGNHLRLANQIADAQLKVADDTQAQVVEELKRAETKKGEMKKRVQGYLSEMVEAREKAEASKEKAKNQYYDACSDNASARQKLEKAGGDAKARKNHDQSLSEMHILKDEYLLLLDACNEHKRSYYTNELPKFEDELQDLHASTIVRLTTLLGHTGSLDSSHHLALARFNQQIWEAYRPIDIVRDQDLFAEHNVRLFKAPPDDVWEPCPGHYAEGKIEAKSEEEKIYLQNRLAVAKTTILKGKAGEQQQAAQIETAKRTVASHEKNRGLGDPDDYRDSMLANLRDIAALRTQVEILEREKSLLEAALGDDVGPQRPHDFKSSAFTIPSDCEYCRSAIWGNLKPGLTCRSCSTNVHVKCAMRLPASCGRASGAGDREKRRSHFGLHRRQSSAIDSETSPGPPVAHKRRSFMLGKRRGSQETVPSKAESIASTRHRREPSEATGYPTTSTPSLQDSLAPPAYVTGPSSSSSSSASLPTATSSAVANHGMAQPGNRETRGGGTITSETYATVLYDYSAADIDELSVQKGQVVKILPSTDIEAEQDGWVRVRHTADPASGRPFAVADLSPWTGLVPGNYIRVLEDVPRAEKRGPDMVQAGQARTHQNGPSLGPSPLQTHLLPQRMAPSSHSAGGNSPAIGSPQRPLPSNNPFATPSSTSGLIGGPRDPVKPQPTHVDPQRDSLEGTRVTALFDYTPAPYATDEIPLVKGRMYRLTAVGWNWGVDDDYAARDEQGRSAWWEIYEESAEGGAAGNHKGLAPGTYLRVV